MTVAMRVWALESKARELTSAPVLTLIGSCWLPPVSLLKVWKSPTDRWDGYQAWLREQDDLMNWMEAFEIDYPGGVIAPPMLEDYGRVLIGVAALDRYQLRRFRQGMDVRDAEYASDRDEASKLDRDAEDELICVMLASTEPVTLDLIEHYKGRVIEAFRAYGAPMA